LQVEQIPFQKSDMTIWIFIISSDDMGRWWWGTWKRWLTM